VAIGAKAYEKRYGNLRRREIEDKPAKISLQDKGVKVVRCRPFGRAFLSLAVSERSPFKCVTIWGASCLQLESALRNVCRSINSSALYRVLCQAVAKVGC
jgi:hypothetical protein